MTKWVSLSRLSSWWRHVREASHWSVTLACLVMASLLAACSAPWEAQPVDTPIPALHAPNVQELSAFFDLEEQEHVEEATFLRAIAPVSSSGSAQVVFALVSHMYRLSVTGTTAERLYPTVPCDPFVGEASDLTRDGMWLICLRPRGNYVVQPSEDPTAPVPAPLAGDTDMDSPPSWAPDGLTLAAAGSFADPRAGYTDHCGIGLYQLSPDRAVVRQIALLRTPDFENMEGVGHNGCRLDSVSWSPDGRTLALYVNESFGQYYFLSITQVSAALAPHSGAAIPVYTVTKAMLIPVSGNDWRWGARWTSDSAGLVLMHNARWAIHYASMATGQAVTLLQLPEKHEHVCDLAPLPDGKRIVFTYCRSQVVEHSTPSQRLYLFTP